jgi:hypothetical protein
MTGRRLLLALLGCLAAALPAAAQGPACGSNNPLTLLGIDTTSGTMLFSAAPGSGAPWLIELNGAGDRARVLPDNAKGRFGGSVGPGPVLAVTPCGEGCLQPVAWTGSAWAPLGKTLHVPTATTVSSTYDRSGTAWILIQSPAQPDGSAQVEAFHLNGQDWEKRGAMAVRAVGEPPALPAPQRKDGVLVGTGLFSASGPPEAWVAGIPSLPPARRGQVIALTGTAVAYLSADGVVYLSDDSGKTWRRSTWTPWESKEGTAGLWRPGSDWWVDLPYGDHEGVLELAWFDRRDASAEKIHLTRLAQGGRWVLLGEARSEVSTRNESLPLSQILVPKGDSWVLLTGCVATAGSTGSSSLVLRVLRDGKLSEPKLVKLEPE